MFICTFSDKIFSASFSYYILHIPKLQSHKAHISILLFNCVCVWVRVCLFLLSIQTTQTYNINENENSLTLIVKRIKCINTKPLFLSFSLLWIFQMFFYSMFEYVYISVYIIIVL